MSRFTAITRALKRTDCTCGSPYLPEGFFDAAFRVPAASTAPENVFHLDKLCTGRAQEEDSFVLAKVVPKPRFMVQSGVMRIDHSPRDAGGRSEGIPRLWPVRQPGGT